MKESTQRPDLQEATKTLGVAVDAPLSKIEEAYRDLKTVWDPTHFVSDDRLKQRAEAELRRIDEAYRLLAASLAPSDPLADLWSTKRDKASRAAEAKKAKLTRSGGPSLIDEVLDSQTERRARRFPIWLIIVIGVATVALVLALLPGSGRKTLESVLQSEEAVEPPPEATPPPVAKAPGETSAVRSQPAAPETQIPPGKDAGSEPAPRQTTQRTQPIRPTPAQPAPPKTESKPADKPQLIRDEGNQTAQKEVRAYQILHQKSDAARRLIEGQVTGLRVLDWNTQPVENQSPADALLVVLSAEQGGSGPPVYLVWAVDMQKETVRPMSQAARDLEGRR